MNFRTTFVKSYATFWLKEASPVVRVKRVPDVGSSSVAKEVTSKNPSAATDVLSTDNKPEEESTRVILLQNIIFNCNLHFVSVCLSPNRDSRLCFVD